MDDTVYKQVISILEVMPKDSYPAIIYEIARDNPDALISAYATLSRVYTKGHTHGPLEGADWDEKIKDIVKKDGKMYAIKWVRSESGWGLKEAKEYVEGLVG